MFWALWNLRDFLLITMSCLAQARGFPRFVSLPFILCDSSDFLLSVLADGNSLAGTMQNFKAIRRGVVNLHKSSQLVSLSITLNSFRVIKPLVLSVWFRFCCW